MYICGTALSLGHVLACAAQVFVKREPFDNSKEAEAELLKQHKADPKSTTVMVKLADIYISRDDWAEAKEYLNKVIELKPDDFGNVAALAEALRREGKTKDAIANERGQGTRHPSLPLHKPSS
jgi:predicted Zn-dependent protease